jgi:hypothetical protein
MILKDCRVGSRLLVSIGRGSKIIQEITIVEKSPDKRIKINNGSETRWLDHAEINNYEVLESLAPIYKKSKVIID